MFRIFEVMIMNSSCKKQLSARHLLKNVAMTASLFLASSCFAASNHLPNIKILATGGTIAGAADTSTQSSYKVAQVGIQTLIDAVPEMKNIANISGEQVANIGSNNMNNEIWLKLAKRTNELLARKDVDGVVITHGTDTMEETAYFLDLTVNSEKPVVLVGSMRPSTAKSADGPMNLYDAVATAVDKESKNLGVLVTMNDRVFEARDVLKTNTTSVQTFMSPNFGPIGYIYDSDVKYRSDLKHSRSQRTHFDVSKLNKLPTVGIVYNYANTSTLPVQSLVNAHYEGIVNAGSGNGSIYDDVKDILTKAVKENTIVVRSARTPTGFVTYDPSYDSGKYGFIPSGVLSPQKSRVLLMLALTKTHNQDKVRKIFNNNAY